MASSQFYFNNWWNCSGVDCCDDPHGCSSCCFRQRVPGSCVETTNHSVVVYRTEDLSTWEYLGEAIRAPRLGIEYRPHVVWNARTQKFVMWCTSTAHQQSGSSSTRI